MGSGKTTIGRVLARQIGWHFVDLDQRIEERAHLTIPEFFSRHGETPFRALEHEELVRILGEARDRRRATVLALGGGTSTQPANLELLRESGAAMLWLDCPAEELLSRCAGITNRPLFRDAASFRQLFLERQSFYALAEFRVDGSADPARVIEQILALGILEGVPA